MLRTYHGKIGLLAVTFMDLPLLTAILWIALSRPASHIAAILLAAIAASGFVCFLMMLRNVHESGLERYRQLAFTDDLTGLPNRRAAMDRLERILSRFTDSSGTLTLAMLDLDGFKHVNDRFGHLAGDLALKTFSDMLRAELRPSDWGARWGGDEFLIMIDGDIAEAQPAMERIREAAEAQAMRSQSAQCKVTIGIAAAHFQEDAVHAIHRADEALIFSKTLGGNRVFIAEETAHELRSVNSTYP